MGRLAANRAHVGKADTPSVSVLAQSPGRSVLPNELEAFFPKISPLIQRRAKTDSARERLVFLYPRQSRAMEEGEEPIEIQEERLRSWILTAITESNADPIRPAIRLVGCEGDLDVSGRTRLLDRPVGRRLAEMITRGEGTEVWVLDLGRLAHNSTSRHQIKAFFDHYNIS